MIMAGVSLCTVPAKAQFNTVAAIPDRYKVEVSRAGTGTVSVLPVPARDTSTL